MLQNYENICEIRIKILSLTVILTIFNSPMEVFQTIKSLQQCLSGIGQEKSLGLVPTMGALHEGHLSIIRRAKKENDFVVVSIFVNPTQFDKKEDLINYPKTISTDLQALESLQCDFVFIPPVEEIYQQSLSTEHFDFDGLDKVMEGKFRPGHFDGRRYLPLHGGLWRRQKKYIAGGIIP
mgnify:CR=1 FL=1